MSSMALTWKQSARSAASGWGAAALVLLFVVAGFVGVHVQDRGSVPNVDAMGPVKVLEKSLHADGALPAKSNLNGYISAVYNVIDGAHLPAGSGGYDLSNNQLAVYDPLSGDLIVTAGSGIGWVNGSTGRLDRLVPLGGAGFSGPGAGSTAMPFGLAIDYVDGLIYITHGGRVYCNICQADYVSVVNLSTGRLVQTIAAGSGLGGLAFDPLNDRVYVADSVDNSVTVLAGNNGTILSHVAVGPTPENVAVDTASGDVYVTDSGSSNLSVINGTTDAVVGTLTVSNVSGVYDVRYDPIRNELYVDGTNPTVAAISLSTGKELYVLPVNANPGVMAFDDAAGELYVTSFSTGTVVEVNVTNSSSPTSVRLYFGDISGGGTYDPRTNEIYLTDFFDVLNVFNVSSGAYLGWFPTSVHADSLTLASPSQQLFASDGQSTIVWATNLTTPGHTFNLRTGQPGRSLVYDSTDRTVIAGSFLDGNAVVINPANDTRLSFLPVGYSSSPLLWDPTNDSLWVWQWCGGTYCSSSVSNYHATNGTFLRNVGLGAEYASPMVYDSTRTALYISGQLSSVSGVTGAVYDIDAANGTLQWTHSMPLTQALTYDPVDHTVWVVALGNPNFNITILNATTGAYVATAAEPGNPNGEPLAYDPADQLVLAVDIANHSELLEYNASTNALVGELPLPGFNFYDMIPTASGGGVYYSDGGPAVREVHFDNAVHITSFTSTPTATEVNGTFRLLLNASGGTAPLTYSYSGLPPPCTSLNSTVLTCHPAGVGQFNVTAKVTDAHGKSYSAELQIRVLPSLRVGPLEVNQTQIHLGSSFQLTASVDGGVGGYDFNWTGLPGGCPPGRSTPFDCAPTQPGRFNISLTVEDAAGDRQSVGPVSVFIVAALHVSLSEELSAVDAEEMTNFTALVTGGTGAESFGWNGLPPGCLSANASSLTCVPTASGTYQVNVTARDPFVQTFTSNTVVLQVYPALIVAAASASRGSVDVGQSVTFWANASGGFGSYSTDWFGLPAGCPDASSTPVTCVPPSPETTHAYAVVTDGLGVSAASTPVTEVVYPLPVIQQMTTSRTAFDLGGSVWLNASVLPGAGADSFRWTGLPPGCASPDQASLDCQPSASGAYNVAVMVVDANGGTATSGSPAAFLVRPDPSILSAVALPGTTTVGGTIQLNVSVTGGTGTYTYQWAAPSGCVVANASTISCTPLRPGSFSATVTVTDSEGRAATSPPIGYTVLQGLLVSPTAASRTLFDIGTPLSFYANASSGTPPFTFAWDGLPPGCASTNVMPLSCTPTAAGTFSVWAAVTDSAGRVADAAAVNVTVVLDPVVVVSVASGSLAPPIGSTVRFSASVVDGIPPYRVSWSVNGTPMGQGNQLNLSVTGTGHYVVGAMVSDSGGGTGTSASLTVLGSSSANSGSPNPFAGLGQAAAWVGLPVGAAVVLGLGLMLRRRKSVR